MDRIKVRWDDPCISHPCASPAITMQSIPLPPEGVLRAEYVLPRDRLHPGVKIWKGKPSAPLQPFGTFSGYVSMPKNDAGEPTIASVAAYDGHILNLDRKLIEESGGYWINPYDPCSEGGFETFCEGLAIGASLAKRPTTLAKKR